MTRLEVIHDDSLHYYPVTDDATWLWESNRQLYWFYDRGDSRVKSPGVDRRPTVPRDRPAAAITWLPAVGCGPDSWTDTENQFSGCAGGARLTAAQCVRPRSPFSDGKNTRNRTYPGWMAGISRASMHLMLCSPMHAIKETNTCTFVSGFQDWFVACFTPARIRNMKPSRNCW